MRLPRKLKKGCRTLQGKPRTRWQRKGQIHIARLFEDIANAVRAAATGMDPLTQIVKSINSFRFPSGGIVPSQNQRMMVGESPGEIVLRRPQLDKLKHAVMADPMDGVRATLSGASLPDILGSVNKGKEGNDYETSTESKI